MKYETQPQGNRAWLAGEFAKLRASIAEALRRATSAQQSLADYQQTQQTATGTLVVVSPHSNNQPANLIRRNGVVYLDFRILTGGAIAANGVIATLPAGFWPVGASNKIFTGARQSGSTWTTQMYYVQPSDGTVRLLQTAAASGDLCTALVPAFPSA